MFDRNELITISQILSQLSFKIGQGNVHKMCEGILQKISTKLKEDLEKKKDNKDKK